MGGAAYAAVAGAAAATGATAAAGGMVGNIAEWADKNKKSPSRSWDDGDNFVPSPELLIEMVQRD